LSLADNFAQFLDWIGSLRIGPFDKMLIVPLPPVVQPRNETPHLQPRAGRMGDYATISAKIKGDAQNRVASWSRRRERILAQRFVRKPMSLALLHAVDQTKIRNRMDWHGDDAPKTRQLVPGPYFRSRGSNRGRRLM
jgi:hypothetical protein